MKRINKRFLSLVIAMLILLSQISPMSVFANEADGGQPSNDVLADTNGFDGDNNDFGGDNNGSGEDNNGSDGDSNISGEDNNGSDGDNNGSDGDNNGSDEDNNGSDGDNNDSNQDNNNPGGKEANPSNINNSQGDYTVTVYIQEYNRTQEDAEPKQIGNVITVSTTANESYKEVITKAVPIVEWHNDLPVLLNWDGMALPENADKPEGIWLWFTGNETPESQNQYPKNSLAEEFVTGDTILTLSFEPSTLDANLAAMSRLPESYTDTEQEVYISYQNGGYKIPKQAAAVSADLSVTYGYDNEDLGVAALDVLIKAHEIYFDMYVNSGDLDTWLRNALIVNNGNVSTCFNEVSGNYLSCLVDGKIPDGADVHYRIPETVVTSGSHVEFLAYNGNFSEYYTWFEDADNNRIENIAINKEDTLSLSIKGDRIYTSDGLMENPGSAPDGGMFAEHGYFGNLSLVMLNPGDGEIIETGDTEKTISKISDDGSFTVSFSEDGAYILSLASDGNIDIFMPWCVVTVGTEPFAAGLSLFSSESEIEAINISGDYKTEYYLGENFSTEKMIITAKYTGGSTVNISLDDPKLVFSGFNDSIKGTQTITVKYGTVKETFDVKVLDPDERTITVSFTLYAIDPASPDVHTYKAGNLTPWIETAEFEISNNATVLDVFKEVSSEKGLKFLINESNYITWVQKGDQKLVEGERYPWLWSGWMFLLNGKSPNFGMANQFLSDGDIIIIHYTDDMGSEDFEFVEVSFSRLEKAISQGENLSGSDYTAASWEALNTALIVANGVASNMWSSQPEVDDALADLKAAIYGLIRLDGKANKFELLDKIEEAEALNEAVYTSESWANLVTVILSSKSTAANENAAQDKVDEAVASLKAAIDNLKLKAQPTGKYEAALNKVLDRIDSTTPNPEMSSTGGDWSVVSRARASRYGTWIDAYLANLASFVQSENCVDGTGKVILNPNLYTDNARAVLALTSLGINAADWEGNNYVSALTNKQQSSGKYQVALQGINVTSWALIAFNSNGYADQSLRDELRNIILASQKSDGGWGLGNSPTSDMTAMAIQALAPYYKSNDQVKSAVDKALSFLSAKQDVNGGFETLLGSEAIAQVIIALTELGIDPIIDNRFVKNGGNMLDALLAYQLDTGGFSHSAGARENTMATEQAACALVAYGRLLQNTNTFYEMSDAIFPATEANKDLLARAIAEASKLLSENRYTSISWSALKSAHEEAEHVLADSGATSSQINVAYARLRDAMNRLVVKPSDDEDTITVYFTLLGDIVHTPTDEGGPVHSLTEGGLVTWISKNAYSVKRDATVLDVFETALANDIATYSWVNRGGSYISSITRDGVTLAEFDNGPNSGWMYTLNGAHAVNGVIDQVLYDNDDLIFHYSDDYTDEADSRDFDSSSSDDSTTTTQADSTHNETVVTATTAVNATVSNGIASIAIGSEEIITALANTMSEMAKAVSSGLPNVVGEVKFHINNTSEAKSVEAKLTAGDIKSIAAEADISLTLESEIASVTFDSASLAGMVTGIEDSTDIKIVMSDVEETELSDEAKEIVGGNPVFDISVMVGETSVHSFDGIITIFLPFEPEVGTDPLELTVYYLSDDNIPTPMVGAYYDKEKRGFIFTTDHLSKFFIAEAPEPEDESAEDEGKQDEKVEQNQPGDEKADWQNPYGDITENDWFYKAVSFVTDRGLMTGVSEDIFEPNSPMTRAMLVTVLYRYAGEPVVTSENDFPDVTADEWYTDAVIWAKESGIVSGYESGLFGTDDSVTREQVVRILYNFAENSEDSEEAMADLSVYEDAGQIAAYAFEAMQWAKGLGIIEGRGQSHLAPKEATTRAEVAQILTKFIQGRLD